MGVPWVFASTDSGFDVCPFIIMEHGNLVKFSSVFVY